MILPAAAPTLLGTDHAIGALALVSLVVILVLAGAGILIVVFSRDHAMRATLEAVARKVGGTVPSGSADLEFAIADRKARLELYEGSKNGWPFSRVVVDVKDAPGTLHVLEVGLGQAFLKLFGAQDLRVGDAAFDEEYVVKATPATLVPQVFCPERRSDLIRTIRRLKGYLDPTFDLNRGVVTVTVREHLDEDASLLTLIQTASEFVGFVDPRSPEIQLGELILPPGGSCPVCGTGLGMPAVNCTSCGTPHHPECWQYMGRCSTYACTGVRGAPEGVR